jgi:hypothetical protein
MQPAAIKNLGRSSGFSFSCACFSRTSQIPKANSILAVSPAAGSHSIDDGGLRMVVGGRSNNMPTSKFQQQGHSQAEESCRLV